MSRLVLPRPDDWHLHVRDGAAMAAVVPLTAASFGRALLMPNTKPPVTTVDEAAAYRERVLAAVPQGADFTPYFALYLTDRTTPDDVRRAKESGFVLAFKLYPAGATTHSDQGVTRLDALAPTLAAMEELGLPLCVHGESTDPLVDIFDREAVFLDRVAAPLLRQFPRLRMVVEHITTSQAADFVVAHDLAATITPQHLLLNRNAIFQGGVRPHHYCLPVLKREEHRLALLRAATSGDRRFFLGTDSAPHARHTKEAACGCAGCFTAPHALALYALAFERAGELDRLADFASGFGADYYGLPRATKTVTLLREPVEVPASFAFGDDEVIPLFAGEVVPWRVLP